MANDLLVVSLGRILADDVRIEADEVHAVLQQVWQHLRSHRANDGGLPLIPALDSLGFTAFGDFQVRPGPAAAAVVRPPHQVGREMADLLAKLVRSGRPEVDRTAALCLAVAERTLTRGTHTTARPITSPDALLRALEAFRPRDPSLALAALFARWMRATDGGKAGGSAAATQKRGLALGIGRPRQDPAASSRPGPPDSEPIVDPAPPRLLFAPPPSPAASPKQTAVRPAPVTHAARQPSQPALTAGTVAAERVRVTVDDLTLRPSTGRSTFVPSLPDRRKRPSAAVAVAAAAVILLSGTVAVLGPADASTRVREAARAVLAHVGVGSGALSAEDHATRRSAVEPGRARQVIGAQDSGAVPYAPAFDPTTHKLVFHAGQDRPELREAALDADGDVADVSTLRVASARSNHIQISPDGQRLAFDSDADGTRGVYVAARDGSNPRRVSGPGHAAVPSWSPDGKSLAFARAEPGRPQVWNVWTVHVPSGRLERRTAHPEGQPWGASWFPDGRRIAYNLEDALIVRDLDSGRAETFRTPVPGRRVRTPAVSPDGTRIVFQVRDDGAWVLDLTSRTPSRVLADASAEEFAWSPDGRRVAYHSFRGGEWGIWLLDLAP